MTCWFCKHPLALSSLRSRTASESEHRVEWACIHCGAQFEVTERFVAPPRITPERLEQILNIPR